MGMISQAAAIPTDDRNRQVSLALKSGPGTRRKGGRITIGRVLLVISGGFNKREVVPCVRCESVIGTDGRHGQKSKAEQKKVNAEANACESRCGGRLCDNDWPRREIGRAIP
jgi:hypothetical protein